MLELLCALLAAPAPAPTAPPPPFVRAVGARLYEGARPFAFVGANVGVMHGEAHRLSYRRVLTAARADGLRVVRIWAFGEHPADASVWFRRWQSFRAGPRGWLPGAGRHLDRVLALAGRLGLRVILVLGNHWEDYGGVPQYLRWARLPRGGYGALDRFFTHPRTTRWYRQHLTRLVGRRNHVTGRRYSEDPTILGWELLNESDVTAVGRAGRRRFFREMLSLLQRRAPRQLRTAGVTGYATPEARAEWLRSCRLPEVSYCDAHLYPEETWRLQRPRDLDAQIDDRAQLARFVARKPLVFGEFGFSAALSRRRDLGTGSRRSPAWWTDRFLGRAHRDGAAGALVWIYVPRSGERRRFPVLVDDASSQPLRLTLRRWAARFRAGLPTAGNPRLGPHQGTRPLYPAQFSLRRPAPAGLRWTPAPSTAGAPPRRWRLRLPVESFVEGRFFDLGFYAGGPLTHIYGAGHGHFAYRVVRAPRAFQRLTLRVRLSSEYPGDTAPPTGTTALRLRLGGRVVARWQAPPDDGLGGVLTAVVTDRALLRRLAAGPLELRLEVPPGPGAHGLCVYGRRGRRPGQGPPPRGAVGPILLEGSRGSAQRRGRRAPRRRPTP